MTNTIYTNKKKTNTQFIEDARIIHGDIYDYSKSNYINNKIKVEIICPEHGSFWQVPTNHLTNKQGCRTCNQHNKYCKKDFVSISDKVHKKKYNYDKVEYIDSTKMVNIICPNHGSFFQKANDHMRGSGCRECYYDIKGGIIIRKDDYDANNICYLYNIKLTNDDEVFYKTGITDNLKRRHTEFKRLKYTVEIIDVIIDTKFNCSVIERKILKKRQRLNKYTPKIKFGGWSECYIMEK